MSSQQREGCPYPNANQARSMRCLEPAPYHDAAGHRLHLTPRGPSRRACPSLRACSGSGAPKRVHCPAVRADLSGIRMSLAAHTVRDAPRSPDAEVPVGLGATVSGLQAACRSTGARCVKGLAAEATSAQGRDQTGALAERMYVSVCPRGTCMCVRGGHRPKVARLRCPGRQVTMGASGSRQSPLPGTGAAGGWQAAAGPRPDEAGQEGCRGAPPVSVPRSAGPCQLRHDLPCVSGFAR
jgi:hypothetical protein